MAVVNRIPSHSSHECTTPLPGTSTVESILSLVYILRKKGIGGDAPTSKTAGLEVDVA